MENVIFCPAQHSLIVQVGVQVNENILVYDKHILMDLNSTHLRVKISMLYGHAPKSENGLVSQNFKKAKTHPYVIYALHK